MKVSIHRRIDELGGGRWDELAGGDIMAGHGWLRTVETASIGRCRPWYLVVEDDGRPLGAAICTFRHGGDPVETLDDMVFGRLRPAAGRLGLSLHPAWVCAAPHGFGSHLLIDRTLPAEHRSRLLVALLDAIETEARDRKIPAAMPHVLESEADLASRLMARGWLRSTHVPINYLDVCWPSFDDYLSHLNTVTRDARKDIRRQINQNRKRGTEIHRIDDPVAYEDRLHRLLDINSRRHNGRPFGFLPRVFSELKRNLGDEAIIYAAFKRGVITGVSVMLVRNGIAHLPWIGVDHEATANDFTYFNLAHYRPIDDAIGHGVTRMYFGRALYELKRRRGCRVGGLSLYVKPATSGGSLALRPWLVLLSTWNRLKLPGGLRRHDSP
jgi:predicted N-acyltransferase